MVNEGGQDQSQASDTSPQTTEAIKALLGSGSRPEGQAFAASPEPAGGQAPPDAVVQAPTPATPQASQSSAEGEN